MEEFKRENVSDGRRIVRYDSSAREYCESLSLSLSLSETPVRKVNSLRPQASLPGRAV